MLRRWIAIWFRHISPQIGTLMSTIGILGLFICLISLWIVAELAEEVWENESFAFDRAVLLWVHQFANPELDRLMLALTQLGNPTTVVPIALITLGFLAWKRPQAEAILFGVACLGGAILSNGLKLLFQKSRPVLWQRLIVETSYSFPSGHALGSMVLYGAIAYLLATRYPDRAWLIYGLAIVLIGAIGLSRLYLGVHWPTDVIAGYGIGFLWLTVCTTMFKLHRLVKPS